MIISEGRVKTEWFRPAHTEQLFDLFRCAYAREAWARADFARFAGAEHRSNVLKALTDDRGTVYGAVLYTLEPDACRVRRVAVWPDYRRRGLGAFMVNTLCGPQALIRRKVFNARVATDDAVGRAFATHLGFAADPAGRRRADPGSDRIWDEFVFRKA